MKAFIQKHKIWLGYAALAVVLTVSLLYFRFPADAVLEFLKAEAGRADLSLSVDSLRPSMRLGLRFDQVKITPKDAADRVLLQADGVLLRPGLLSYLGGGLSCSFDASAYQGDISGRVHFKGKEPTGTMETQIALTNIRVGDYSFPPDFMARPVEGILGGTISYSGVSNDPAAAGSGEAKLKMVNGKFQLLEPFLTFESMDFKEMDMELILKERRINVTRLEIKGDQMQGTLSGQILLKDELADSTLNLKGTIQPFAAFFEKSGGTHDTVAFFKERLKQGSLSFVIEGTLKDPEIKSA